MTSTRSRPADYFTAPARSAARLVLFCLPPAGGGASAFRGWIPALPTDLDVQPIRLPGREARIDEPAEIDLPDLAEAIATRIDRPYAVCGHSLGGLIGFEVLRTLRHRGLPAPVRFYVAGTRPPHVRDPLADAARDSDDAFIARLAELGGTPDGVFDHPELRELVLPALRADFAWFDAYAYRPERPLDAPIVGLAGTRDRVVPAPEMHDWARHTTAGFRLHSIAGDHFFIQHAVGEIAPLIAADLRDALDGAPR